VNDEWLVGGLAGVMSLCFLAFALGPWEKPYQLRAIQAIAERFGKLVARFFWLLLAVMMGGLGIAIVTGKRPGYAVPLSFERSKIHSAWAMEVTSESQVANLDQSRKVSFE